MDARILFQDECILVVYKPYGVLSEAHDSRPNMPALLRELCGGGICPVHRLDRTTQGLMVYARDGKTAAAEIKKSHPQMVIIAQTAFALFGEREEILAAVWPGDALVGERSVDVHIARLRKKLGTEGSRIVNKTGFGYGLV